MKESPRYARLQTIDQTIPSKKFASKIADLPRKHGSLIFQLRTGHVPLNKHLITENQRSLSTLIYTLSCR
jgi:hypothetical protein